LGKKQRLEKSNKKRSGEVNKLKAARQTCLPSRVFFIRKVNMKLDDGVMWSTDVTEDKKFEKERQNSWE